jgi:hypothetical protein
MGSMGGTIAKYALPAVGGLAAVGLGVLLLARGGRRAATAPSPVTIILSLPGGPLAEAMAGRA